MAASTLGALHAPFAACRTRDMGPPRQKQCVVRHGPGLLWHQVGGVQRHCLHCSCTLKSCCSDVEVQRRQLHGIGPVPREAGAHAHSVNRCACTYSVS